VSRSDLDRLNFQELSAGTSPPPLGWINSEGFGLHDVKDEQGRDVCLDYFTIAEDGQLSLQRAVMPSMLTKVSVTAVILRHERVGFALVRDSLHNPKGVSGTAKIEAGRWHASGLR
jgi:hypothetical protein